MNRLRQYVLLASLAIPAAVCLADETPLSPDYLVGNWSLDGKAGCGSAKARYVLFRDSGTVEVGHGGEVTRVGFWKIVDDTLVSHTLTAPREREEFHPFFQDSYRYEYNAPRILEAQPDTFDVSIGSDIEKEKQKYTLSRCP